MMTGLLPQRGPGVIELLNTRWHKPLLETFGLIVVAHWVEHIAQAVQIYALDWPRHQANGALGLVKPWLVTSEWMHYGYGLIMLIGLVALRHGFTGRFRTALWIQVWHHLEHLLLLLQAVTGRNLLGGTSPPASFSSWRPGRTAPVLQRRGVRADGDRDSVPPSASAGRAVADAVLVRGARR